MYESVRLVSEAGDPSGGVYAVIGGGLYHVANPDAAVDAFGPAWGTRVETISPADFAALRLSSAGRAGSPGYADIAVSAGGGNIRGAVDVAAAMSQERRSSLVPLLVVGALFLLMRRR